MKVVINKIDDFGRGVGNVQGKVVFVSNALPYEEVSIKVIKENKKYLEAVVDEYITTSNDRVVEQCKYFSECGGCCLCHMSYLLENEYKEKKVKDIMKKFALLDDSIVRPIEYSNRDNYRNKVVLHGDGKSLGFYLPKSKTIIDISNCLLLNEKINQVIDIIRGINVNIREVIIKTSNDLKNVLISIYGEVSNTELLKKYCDVLIINGEHLTDKKDIMSEIGMHKYYQSVNSFFQVNTTLTEKLYDKVYEALDGFNYEKALDLYCGTGTIGIYVSSLCKEIIGIDYNESNILDAERNKILNKCSNISFICDKVENRIDTFKDIDVVIVDPPRAGLDSKTRKYLLEILSKKIVYVSCDPVTLARDLKELSTEYDVTSITPFNMFPRTYHVECVSVLTRKR